MEILMFALAMYMTMYVTEKAKGQWRHQRNQHAAQIRRDHPNMSEGMVSALARLRNWHWWGHEIRNGGPTFRAAWREGHEHVRYLREHAAIGHETRTAAWRRAHQDLRRRRAEYETYERETRGRGEIPVSFGDWYGEQVRKERAAARRAVGSRGSSGAGSGARAGLGSGGGPSSAAAGSRAIGSGSGSTAGSGGESGGGSAASSRAAAAGGSGSSGTGVAPGATPSRRTPARSGGAGSAGSPGSGADSAAPPGAAGAAAGCAAGAAAAGGRSGPGGSSAASADDMSDRARAGMEADQRFAEMRSAKDRGDRAAQLVDASDQARLDRNAADRDCSQASTAYHEALVKGDQEAIDAADQQYRRAAERRIEAERRYAEADRELDAMGLTPGEWREARQRADERRHNAAANAPAAGATADGHRNETAAAGDPEGAVLTGQPAGAQPGAEADAAGRGGNGASPDGQARRTGLAGDAAAAGRDQAVAQAQDGVATRPAENGNRPKDASAAGAPGAQSAEAEAAAAERDSDAAARDAAAAALAGDPPAASEALGRYDNAEARRREAEAAAEEAAWHAPEDGTTGAAAAAVDGLSAPRPGEPGPGEGVAGYREGTDELGGYREPVYDEAFAQGARDWQRHGEMPDPGHWTSRPYGEMTPAQRAAYDAAERDIRQAGWGENVDDVRPSVRRTLMEQHYGAANGSTAASGNGATSPGQLAGESLNGNHTYHGGNEVSGPNGELAGDSKYRAAQAAMATFEAEALRYQQAAETLEAELTAVGFDRDPAVMTPIRGLRETAGQVTTHTSGAKNALDAHQPGAEYHETGTDADHTAYRTS